MDAKMTQTFTARWVFPVDGPPLDRGTVTIQADRITHVQATGERSADVDLGNVAILPGFTNAHTHLDLSGTLGRCPPDLVFPNWLRQVTAQRYATPSEDVHRAIAAGLDACLRTGTTLVGDIASQGASWSQLCQAPMRAVVFYELLGLSRPRAEQAGQAADGWLNAISATDTCRPGLSPHAPYSVRRDLFERVAARGQPVAIHLSESREELELLRSHAGPFVSFLQERGVWDPAGLVDDPASLLRLYRHVPSALFVHANYGAGDWPLTPAQTVVYCPRTHAAFGHPPHPFRALLRRDVRVALGTDSLASNPDLDILSEARFVAPRHPDLDGGALLRMLTLSGAEALGWGAVTGSLAPGKSADLVVLPLPDRDEADPYRLVFESDHGVRAVMFRGRWRGAAG